MQTIVSDAKEKFFNFEVQRDDDRYIISAQVQGNELTPDEYNAIQAFGQNNVSVIFNHSSLFIRAYVLRGSFKNSKINLQVFL
jgi:hypothetical protein